MAALASMCALPAVKATVAAAPVPPPPLKVTVGAEV